jgi:hypothetical protein
MIRVNLQVIASPHGDVLWVSGGLPGSVHDKEGRVDLGRPGRTGGRRPGRSRRQRLPGQHVRAPAVQEAQGREDPRLRTGGQPRPRPPPRPRRARERPAQELGNPPQGTLLPDHHRQARQGNSRPATARGRLTCELKRFTGGPSFKGIHAATPQFLRVPRLHQPGSWRGAHLSSAGRSEGRSKAATTNLGTGSPVRTAQLNCAATVST